MMWWVCDIIDTCGMMRGDCNRDCTAVGVYVEFGMCVESCYVSPEMFVMYHSEPCIIISFDRACREHFTTITHSLYVSQCSLCTDTDVSQRYV